MVSDHSRQRRTAADRLCLQRSACTPMHAVSEQAGPQYPPARLQLFSLVQKLAVRLQSAWSLL